MTIKEFSDYLNFPKGTLEKYLNSPRLPNAEFLSALHSKMNVSTHWLLEGVEPMYLVGAGELERLGVIPMREGPHSSPVQFAVDEAHRHSDFIPIKRFSVEASAGGGALVDKEDHSGTYAFHRKWLDRRQLDPTNLAVIAVRGDSMEPKLADGDLILVDRAQRQIADGLAYVLRLGTNLLVKYVQRIGPTKVAILSANTFCPAREIDAESFAEEIEIIGRVVASMHEW